MDWPKSYLNFICVQKNIFDANKMKLLIENWLFSEKQRKEEEFNWIFLPQFWNETAAKA